MSGLLLPVGPRRMSSWEAHQRRNPRSTEPGTDWYCPIGTPVLAPADGRIYGYGTDIRPATGLWNGIEFFNGMSFRAMHYSDLLRTSGTVERGEPIALSGASGYGVWDWSDNPDTGGEHVHGTLWPTWTRRFGYQSNGKPWTVDFMAYADLSGTAGGGSTPFEEDDMTPLEMLQAKFRTGRTVNGVQEEVQLVDALKAIYFYGDHLNKMLGSVPGQVWAHPMQHPLLSDVKVAAGDFLRYEPAEHENTRRAVAAVAVGDIDYDRIAAEIAEQYPNLDPHAFAVAAADEADRRERERLGS